MTGNIARVLIKLLAEAGEFQGKLISFTGNCRTSGFRENDLIIPIEIPIDPYRGSRFRFEPADLGDHYGNAATPRPSGVFGGDAFQV